MSNTKPLEKLLTYIDENIYTKMKKKDVKEIKSKYLGGELLHQIDIYKKECVYEAIEKTRKEYTREESKNDWNPEDVYPSNRKNVCD
jgi:hypothetical protein